jgi:hypothetical protein
VSALLRCPVFALLLLLDGQSVRDCEEKEIFGFFEIAIGGVTGVSSPSPGGLSYPVGKTAGLDLVSCLDTKDKKYTQDRRCFRNPNSLVRTQAAGAFTSNLNFSKPPQPTITTAFLFPTRICILHSFFVLFYDLFHLF